MGLSATGDSDTLNYYDTIAARQTLHLRPQLEHLDRLILASEGIDPATLTFAFRRLWQMDASTASTVALAKEQATQIYAGLGLWPTGVTARLVEAQVIADGTYPNAAAVFGEAGAAPVADASTGDAFSGGFGLAVLPDRAARGEWPVDDGGRLSDI